MSELMKKLAEMMPKRNTEPAPSGRQMISFLLEPIRQHANQFDPCCPMLPKTQDEMVAMLWVFGEQIAGEMENRMNYALNMANDAINTQKPTIVYSPEKPS